jgi:hypothetical protein
MRRDVPGLPCRLPTQIDAENYFVRARLLHPIYYPKYWLALQSTNATWPTFKWTDGFTPGPDGYTGAYTNWGVRTDGAKEPSTKGHLCGVADFLLARNVTATLAIQWGWNDVSCSGSYPAMCWQPPREQRARCFRPGYGQRRWLTA